MKYIAAFVLGVLLVVVLRRLAAESVYLDLFLMIVYITCWIMAVIVGLLFSLLAAVYAKRSIDSKAENSR